MTTIVNLLALSASLWLWFYIITRSPHSVPSRLVALMLWSLDIYLLCNLLVANVPINVFISWLNQLSLLAIPFMLHLFVRLSAHQAKVQFLRHWIS